MEISPSSKDVYFDGCKHNGTDPFDAWFPAHGYASVAIKEWTAGGRPMLYVKTWNHMLDV